MSTTDNQKKAVVICMAVGIQSNSDAERKLIISISSALDEKDTQLAAAIERAERAEALLREARYDVMIMESDGLLRRIDAAIKEQGGA